MTLLSESRPLALVVEDKAELLQLRVELLEANGFIAVGACSKRDAERELRACPSVDIIVTDVNLDPNQETDRSGLDLAREVRRKNPDMPLVGYSGQFGALPQSDIESFNSVHLKGSETPAAIRGHINNWKSLAMKYRSSRERDANRELDRLRERYQIDRYDYSLLREFLPAGQSTSTVDGATIENALRTAGYRLRIIQAAGAREEGSLLRRLRMPLPLWIRDGAGFVVVEVYGMTSLYASGTTEVEAIEHLLELMEGYHQDLQNEDDDTLGPEVRELRDFVGHFLG